MEWSVLEKYRENGYINIDKFLEDNKDIADTIFREVRGSENREKDWITIGDVDILLRTENLIDEEVYNTSFAELLTEEVAKQVGIEAAHYDLITYKGEKGVLSQSVLKEDESLINMSTVLTNLGNYENIEDTLDFIDFEEVLLAIKKLKDCEECITKEDMLKMQEDFCKIVVFDIFSMNTDRNGQNFSIISSKDSYRIAPIYDNEHSFGGGLDKKTIEMINSDNVKAKKTSELLLPVLEASGECTMDITQNWKDYSPREDEKYNIPFNWQTLIFAIGEDLENENVSDFFINCFKNINISKAFSAVEERIGIKIPPEYKESVEKIYNERKKYINDALILEELEEEIEEI
ncbi:MAG: HipA domain-containing protein [Clostridia bacterium]